MLDKLIILAQRDGNSEWITLVVFIVIIVFNAIGGIIKASRDKQQSKRTDEPGAKKRYKPAEQWGQSSQPAQKQGLSPEQRQKIHQQKETLLSPKLQEMLMAQQQQEREHQLRQKKAEQMRKTRLVAERQRKLQQQLLENQRRMQEKPKRVAVKRDRAKVTRKTPSYNYRLDKASRSQLRNIIVASEILSKPVALRKPDERL